MTVNTVIVAAALYGALLFAVAALADHRAARGHGRWLQWPLIYPLSLSVYCTGWTFYGAIGSASRSGLEYLTIYLGPTLVLIGWWTILGRMVRIGRRERLTSIADLVSSRFGKSRLVAVIVSLLALTTSIPYIALQLQSITLSVSVFDGGSGRGSAGWVAVVLTLFTILFGTRNVDVNQHHHGVVMAIAVEAVVKLVAVLAVGVAVVWVFAGGLPETAQMVRASHIATFDQSAQRWAVLILLSMTAFLTLPRMFQVMVVENISDRQLATASWAFPLYLMAMSLFTVPIAIVGEALLPGANPDLYVLSLPLSQGQDGLALLAFLGGLSSATSMVIVSTIALSTMLSNHLALPLWLDATRARAALSGDVRSVLILTRRGAMVVTMALAYAYLRLSEQGDLAAIGLLSFAGIAQIGPALLAGLYWRGATRVGAAAGLLTGGGVWLWCMLLPATGLLPPGVVDNGPLGLSWLRPQALFGTHGMDPVVHGAIWSLLFNAIALVVSSLLTRPSLVERMQASGFASAAARTQPAADLGAEVQELIVLSQRIIGASEAQAFFDDEAVRQGVAAGALPNVTPDLLDRLERLMAGSVGAATAHAMIGQMTGGATVSVEDLFAVADEAAQILEYSTQLEAKSREQSRTAKALRDANVKLTRLSRQKDAFLSQISHELRTPMTSIRSFSDILAGEDLPLEDRRRFARIIHEEAMRLTRLLDDLLDLSVLENGQVSLNLQPVRLSDVIDRALTATHGARGDMLVTIEGELDAIQLMTDADRFAQVFINLITNAARYCQASPVRLIIRARLVDDDVRVDVIDNGTGIPAEQQEMIFEKFSRLSAEGQAGSAGLGLAICREVMSRLGGRIHYVPDQGGAAFRICLPAVKRSERNRRLGSASG